MKKRLKLCLIVSGLNNGGIETYIKNYFSKMNLKNYDLFIITHNIPTKDVKKDFQSIGFKIISVPPKRKNLLKNILMIKKYIKKYDFDIVHSNMVKSNFIPMYFAKKYGVKLRIAHSHNVIPTNNYVMKFLLKIMQYLNRKYANYFLGCSKEALLYGFGEKIFSNKYSYRIMYNAIDVNKFRFNNKFRKEIRANFNISEDDILIGNVARFTYQKNHEFLINLLEKVNIKNKKFKLLLIGDGEEKNTIIKFVKEKKLDDLVIFINSTENINKYYSAFDIFLMPSRFEGLGICALEAQVNGLKLILSNNFPDEVVQSDKVMRISLNDIEKWIDELLSFDSNYERKNIVINKSYEINSEYKILENLYRGVKNETD